MTSERTPDTPAPPFPPYTPSDAIGGDDANHPPRARRRRPLRDQPYLLKWLVIGSAVGAVAGLGALALYGSLALVTRGTLGLLAHFSPAAVGHTSPASEIGRPWIVPLLAACGAVLGAIVVRRLTPDASGHGTDAAIKAIHREPRGMRGRVTVVTTAAAALTMGTGGSGGTEGPVTQVGATFGSVSARVFHLGDADARVAATSGLAAGVGAIFMAPFAGALLGVELLYRRGVAPEMAVPGLIATAVAYVEFAAFRGFHPMFGDVSADPAAFRVLPIFLALGLVAGLAARCYCWTYHRTEEFFAARRNLPWPVKPAIGGLTVGTLGLLLPDVLGTSYGLVQSSLDAGWLLGVPLWVVLALAPAKIAATSLTVGSGGTAGIFGPGMVIGAATGAACWRLAEMAGVPVDGPAPFVIAAMAACLGAAVHAPLALAVMAVEVTGALDLLIPTVLAVAVATVVIGDATLYPSQPRRKGSPL